MQFSVLQPLTTGIIMSANAWCLAAQRLRPDRGAAMSIAAAVTYASARIASVCAFMLISMRRTSGWRMMGTGLGAAGEIAPLHALLGIAERQLVSAL